MPQSHMTLHDLEIFTQIGVTAEERQNPQPVYFDVVLELESLPIGCDSDLLEDTICYATLAEKLRECALTPRNLIEKLAQDAFEILKRSTPPQTRIWIRVSKSFPLKNLPRASFSVGETFSSPPAPRASVS